MRTTLANDKDKLKKLSLGGVENDFNAISAEVNNFLGSFEKEKEAKKEFDAKQSGIDSSTYQCQQQFANLQKSMPSYRNAYKIENTYLTQIELIQDMIDEMNNKKRNLDSYINSATKLPFSMLVTTIDELESKVKIIQKAFDDFHDYLLSLKADTERAYKYIRSSYATLKYDEYLLRKANIDTLTDIIQPRIKQGYTYITAMDSFLKVVPIDVNKLNSDYQEAYDHIGRLDVDIKETIKNQTRAEDLIVWDNSYRPDSADARQTLEIAEAAFLEADFTRASDAAASIYKKEIAHK